MTQLDQLPIDELERLIVGEIERLTIDPARVWQGVTVSDHLVICPTCSALVLWRDKAGHRKFHADLVTALTAAIIADTEPLEPPF